MSLPTLSVRVGFALWTLSYLTIASAAAATDCADDDPKALLEAAKKASVECCDLLNAEQGASARVKAEEALAIYRRIHGDGEHDDVAGAIMLVGNCYFSQRQYPEALIRYEESLAIRRRIHRGEDSKEVAASLNNVAICLGAMGRVAESLATFFEELELQKRIYKDEDNAQIVVNHKEIARLLDKLGRYSTAIEHFEQVLAIQRRRFKEGPELAQSIVDLGTCLYRADRYEESLVRLTEALEMDRKIAGDQGSEIVVRDLTNQAICLEAMGRYAKAMANYEEVVAMTRRLLKKEDHVTIANAINSIGGCLFHEGRQELALPKLEEAYAMYKRLYGEKDHAKVAMALDNIGGCLQSLGRNDDAMPKLEESLAMYLRLSKGKDDQSVAQQMQNLAECLVMVGRTSQGLALFEEAAAMCGRMYKGRDDVRMARSLNNLANCLRNTFGRTKEALPKLEQSLEMRRRIYKGQDNVELATALNNLGLCLEDLGRANEALAYFQEAKDMLLRLSKEKPNPLLPTVLSAYALLADRLGRNAETIPALEQALDLERTIHEGRDHPLVASRLHNLGFYLCRNSRDRDGVELEEQAIAMARRCNDRDTYRYAAALGWTHLLRKDYERAAKVFQVAIDSLEESRRRSGGDDDERLRLYSTQANHSDAYNGMAITKIALKQPNEALEFQERGRARVLIDLLERGRQGGGDVLSNLEKSAEAQGDRATLEQIKKARTALQSAESNTNKLRTQIGLLQARAVLSEDQKKQLQEMSIRLNEMQDAYKSARRDVYNLAGDNITAEVKPVQAMQVQKMLHGRQRLLIYGVGVHMVSLIVVRPEGQPIEGYQLKWPNGEYVTDATLLRAVTGYIASIMRDGSKARGLDYVPTTRPSSDDEGMQLFEALIPKGLWKELQEMELVYLCPDRSLHRLPFEALLTGKTDAGNAYWIDSGPAIVQGASAAMLMDRIKAGQSQRETKKTPTHQLVALGDPVFNREEGTAPWAAPQMGNKRLVAAAERANQVQRFGTLAQLPGTRKEVADVYKSVAGKEYLEADLSEEFVVLTGERATRPQLFKQAAGARYLHLATHGLSAGGRYAIYSGLALTQPQAPSAEDSGFLTLADLLDNWWGRLKQTELVVLSACDSQGAKNFAGTEGAFGLPWGFMYAGAPAVIASLWRVDDAATAQMMGNLYKEIREREGKPQAKLQSLQAVRKELKKQHPQPYFWAPFIYTGDPG